MKYQEKNRKKKQFSDGDLREALKGTKSMVSINHRTSETTY